MRLVVASQGPKRLPMGSSPTGLNPVRAAMTATAAAWEWSSTRAQVSGPWPNSMDCRANSKPRGASYANRRPCGPAGAAASLWNPSKNCRKP